MINKVVGELSGSTIAKIGLNMAKPAMMENGITRINPWNCKQPVEGKGGGGVGESNDLANFSSRITENRSSDDTAKIC